MWPDRCGFTCRLTNLGFAKIELNRITSLIFLRQQANMANHNPPWGTRSCDRPHSFGRAALRR